MYLLKFETTGEVRQPTFNQKRHANYIVNYTYSCKTVIFQTKLSFYHPGLFLFILSSLFFIRKNHSRSPQKWLKPGGKQVSGLERFFWQTKD